MGSKLPQLARLIVVAIVAASTPAVAQQPSAADLMKQGGEAFKAGRYDEAIAAITRSYELDPRPDTLFALAQAERLGGRCKDAIPHYKKLIEQLTDLEKAKLVQSNLALCEKTDPVEKAPPKPDIQPIQPPEPIKTVVRVERKTDVLAVALLAGGALGLGAGAGFYVAANASRDAAIDARTLEDSRRFHDRADVQRALSYTAFGAGAAMMGYAVYRWVRPAEPRAVVSIAPGVTSATVLVTTSW